MRQILSALLLFTFCMKALASVPDFSKIQIPNYDKSEGPVWIHKTNKSHVLTALVLENAWFDLKSSDVNSYVQKLEEARSLTNAFAGISDWLVTEKNFKIENGRTILTLKGHYRQNHQDVYFTELQIFNSPHIYQVKISSPNSLDLKDEDSQKIFHSFAELIP